MTPDELAARLPRGFLLGAATSAPQIEGAVEADGRGPSGWDAFAAEPGRIVDGSTPAVATDSYRRWRDDVALLADGGFDAYRFSIAWPRIQPAGTGPANAAGLDHYERLVDALLAAGIRPMATLYHWDTPLPLERAGGWLNRDTAERLGDYAALVAARLGDRVADWVTVNEPFTVTVDGYALGTHAPGETRLFRSLRAAKNLLLGHGHALAALRAAGVAGRAGITNVHSPVSPASEAKADRTMAALFDLIHNTLFADPVLLGRSPRLPAGLPLGLRLAIAPLLRWSRAELALVSQPIDFYGVNYYMPSRVAAGADPRGSTPDGEAEAMKDVPFHLAPWPDLPVTGFGWPVAPEGLRQTLAELAARYPALPPVTITEGGASFPDEVADGAVDDPDRVAYLASHLAVAADAAAAIPGLELDGYYVWSLLDNWEWAAGFTQRFGVVHVDFATGVRTPKSSYRFLRELQTIRRT